MIGVLFEIVKWLVWKGIFIHSVISFTATVNQQLTDPPVQEEQRIADEGHTSASEEERGKSYELLLLKMSSLRKQSTFHDATNGFLAKWRLRNVILMTRHYPDLGSGTSLVSSFCTRCCDVKSRGNQWCCKMCGCLLNLKNKKSP